MSVPPLLGRASPIRSTVQHSRGLTRRGDFHLERERYTTAPVYWSATIDTQEPQRLESSTGSSDSYRVSVAETLQLPCCPVIPAPPLVRNSSPVGYLSGEPGVSPFLLVLSSFHHTLRLHGLHGRRTILLAKIEHRLSVTPTTTSRIMTLPFPHRTRVFHHLML
ncbi:hypothetical protein PISMIDRAFT_424544 [Pisolithus microcarpus 441]|uniref:Uncharacterized protein n=1 Tax=Pisolithus microcarpus 441 TaxID=765257 RepID=A0A0C9YFM2_9AGAM|nr:hypothetical protein BKA83DRAFT_424544 [Pisolithus microcarpus]KIK12734.1 hypothetical protein PISMIDRAFT_424544 [Pisolithus microcarpus 441]